MGRSSRSWALKLFPLVLVGALATASCNIQAGKNHYILAERLFADQKYAAAVEEFRKIVEEDSRGALAQQALFRIGMIQYLYVGNYPEAIRSFRQFSALSQNSEMTYQAEKAIGEIYFSKLEEHRLAIDQYKRLLERFPESAERDFFMLRLAKSYYGALDFEKAVTAYRDLVKKFPKSPLGAEALYQVGNTYFTKGDCEEAIDAFEEVLIGFPGSPQAVFSRFGMGNCYEELEKPDVALKIYESILEKHPSRGVVEAKIRRLKEKQARAR